jgi:hypothetical protein
MNSLNHYVHGTCFNRFPPLIFCIVLCQIVVSTGKLRLRLLLVGFVGLSAHKRVFS